MEDLVDWLRRHSLLSLHDTFTEHNLDVAVLKDANRDDLIAIGIPLGDCLRILAAVKKDTQRSQPIDERRQLSVILCDLVDSTERVERLGDEVYYRLLMHYSRAVEAVMQRYGGTITRYEGDGIQVLFGYPIAFEDGPERAVRAAVEAVKVVSRIEEEPNAKQFKKLSSRVGVATGG